MNKDRKLALSLVLLPLTVLGVIGIAFIYVLIAPFMEEDKQYYVAEAEMYIKLVRPPMDKYGYVLFSKDSIFSLSDKVDYLKVHKSDVSSFGLLMNPNQLNEIIVVDQRGWSVVFINQVKYKIIRRSHEDTLLFEKKEIGGADAHVAKYPNTSITIDGYLRTVYMESNDHLHEMNPINE